MNYKWPENKRCAVSLSFDFDGETPYLWRTRNEETHRLGELEQRRFGPRQGIYRILDLLKKYEISASFFIPGWIAEQYPLAVEAIHAGGHEIGLHGFLHERVDQLSLQEVEESIVKGKEAIERIIGPREFGYRSPSWEMTKETFDSLRKHGIIYDSSLMGYDHPYSINGIPEIPVQWLLDDAIFYRYVGSNDSTPPQNPSNVLDIWKREYDGIKQYGGLFLLTMHPWISGRASRLLALEELISYIKRDSEVWWATCEEIAQYYKENNCHLYRETI
jgi:peptidoglycan-N-acetylglucosamine deacetylase